MPTVPTVGGWLLLKDQALLSSALYQGHSEVLPGQLPTDANIITMNDE